MGSYLLIRATGRPFRRFGILFTRDQATKVPLADLDAARVRELEHCERAGVLKVEDMILEPGDVALRADGPTFEEYVAAGYKPENYPPEGYAAVRSPGFEEYQAMRESEAAQEEAAQDAPSGPVDEPAPAPPPEPAPRAETQPAAPQARRKGRR